MGRIPSFRTMRNYPEISKEWRKSQLEILRIEDAQQNKPSGLRICSDPRSLGLLMLMFVIFLAGIALFMVLDHYEKTKLVSDVYGQHSSPRDTPFGLGGAHRETGESSVPPDWVTV